MFQSRPGTNGLTEQLGRRRGKNDDWQCTLCGDESESVLLSVLCNERTPILNE